MAGLNVDQGRYAEAELLYKRSLAILEKVLGLAHPDVATTLNNLARLYADQLIHPRYRCRGEKSLDPRRL